MAADPRRRHQGGEAVEQLERRQEQRATAAVAPLRHCPSSHDGRRGAAGLWGYWQAGVDPVRSRIVIVMGIVGKLAIVDLALGHVLAGNLGVAFMAVLAVDFVFALLF